MIAPRLPRLLSRAAIALVILLVVWACGLAQSVVSPPRNGLDEFDRPLAQLMDQVDQQGVAKREVILLRDYSTSHPSLFDGLVDALARKGVKVGVDANKARIFGPQRVTSPAKATEVWYVTEQNSLLTILLKMPGARLIASTNPLSGADTAELTRLQQSLRQRCGR